LERGFGSGEGCLTIADLVIGGLVNGDLVSVYPERDMVGNALKAVIGEAYNDFPYCKADKSGNPQSIRMDEHSISISEGTAIAVGNTS
jgi:hypothetical protein